MGGPDSISEFSASHLGHRPVPRDLRVLLQLPWPAAPVLSGLSMLRGNLPPTLIAEECSGRNDLSGSERVAHALAMKDMLGYSGFVAEGSRGEALAYWFGPSQYAIEVAPLMMFGPNGSFSVLPGNGIAEALLVLAAHGDDQLFGTLREKLSRYGVDVVPDSLAEIRIPQCSPTPQSVYELSLASYRADLLAARPPQSGQPVEIEAIDRGPRLSSSDEGQLREK